MTAEQSASKEREALCDVFFLNVIFEYCFMFTSVWVSWQTLYKYHVLLLWKSLWHLLRKGPPFQWFRWNVSTLVKHQLADLKRGSCRFRKAKSYFVMCPSLLLVNSTFICQTFKWSSALLKTEQHVCNWSQTSVFNESRAAQSSLEVQAKTNIKAQS